MKKSTNETTVTGIFTGHPRGYGFVTPASENENNNSAAIGRAADIFIPAARVNGALHGDTVVCVIMEEAVLDVHGYTPQSRETNPQRREGTIISVIKRGKTEYAGTYCENNGDGYILPMEPKISYLFFVTPRTRKMFALAEGHRVMFSVDIKQPEPENPRAYIREVLGHRNDPGVDVLSIVRQYGISYVFPHEVMDEAACLPDVVGEEALENRLDLRGEAIITIDGEDTKDIDDAVSLRVTPEGLFELGVHIADVSHYVREGSPLDHEALHRGTSVYLADRVIPMLPHKLSNGICSLNPHEDRLTLSCLMTIDDEGHVLAHQIIPSVISSKRRFTYERVHALLSEETDPGEDADWISMLRNLSRLRNILRAKRLSRGALEFEIPETKIRVDDNGRPVSVAPYERNDATGIIEECMIVCNETVATHFYWLDTPFVYRTHQKPEPENWRQLAAFTRGLGFTLRGSQQHSGALQQLLARVKGKPVEAIIAQAVLRSLPKACYTHDDPAHYGLALTHYCHFTSPIRRYPDLQIHRIIKQQLSGAGTEEETHLRGMLPGVCAQCSRTERTAESLEREVTQLKIVQYMLDKEGCVFDSVVSGVTPWGVYVTLPNTAEGLIPIERLRGIRHEPPRPGDRMRVMLSRVSEEERKLFFKPV